MPLRLPKKASAIGHNQNDRPHVPISQRPPPAQTLTHRMRQMNCSIARLAKRAGVTPTCVWYRMNFATKQDHVAWLIDCLEAPQHDPDGTMVEIQLSDDDQQCLEEAFDDESWQERFDYALQWRER